MTTDGSPPAARQAGCVGALRTSGRPADTVHEPRDTPAAIDRRAFTRTHGSRRRRVVIAGAGIAALEALLALRALAGWRLEIHALAPGEAFLHRPMSVADSFNGASVEDPDLTALLGAAHATRTVDLLRAVDARERTALTRSGERLGYDDLVVAVGAHAVPLVPGALAFRGRPDVPALREMLRDLDARRISHVVFALPAGNAWPVPLYELALVTAARIAAQRLPAQVSVVSAERAPLERFGREAGEAVAALLDERDIHLHLGASATRFRSGVLQLAGGGELRADRVVALPRLCGPALDGLPADDEGFIPIDCQGRVHGLDGVYAAGDATAGALKHGGLAAMQADAVAEAIAEQAGAAVAARPHPTVIRGLLLT